MNDILGQIQGLAGSAAQAFINRELGNVNQRLTTAATPVPAAGRAWPKWALPAAIGGAVLLLVGGLLLASRR